MTIKIVGRSPAKVALDDLRKLPTLNEIGATCCICGRSFTTDKPSVKLNNWDYAHATCEDPDNPGRRFIKGLEKETEKVERRGHERQLREMRRAGW